ncbi:hypothetical protein RFI_28028 [Reticulomyxa filosa]|uniref:Uncharacterized protein n=1 Tax=Reticulomyxa filosa TaxID=46433 RepID=X6M5Z6_RETFI|nr:hypothetical protein RFI_28028 [Reticulomyxa filosa]|eukprot:ETO09349.1 hypothetical protein RFI_28028 [Reticulomyxa filosa]
MLGENEQLLRDEEMARQLQQEELGVDHGFNDNDNPDIVAPLLNNNDNAAVGSSRIIIYLFICLLFCRRIIVFFFLLHKKKEFKNCLKYVYLICWLFTVWRRDRIQVKPEDKSEGMCWRVLVMSILNLQGFCWEEWY